MNKKIRKKLDPLLIDFLMFGIVGITFIVFIAIVALIIKNGVPYLFEILKVVV